MAAVIRGAVKPNVSSALPGSKGLAYKKAKAQRKPKRTSQGLNHKPKNKGARKNWKADRGQGHP